jgi:hypothetical protein
MKRLLLCCMTTGAIACGAFLADTGDDRNREPEEADAASSADGPSTSGEGGSVIDSDAAGNDAAESDASQRLGATCESVKCAAGAPCCVTTSTAMCEVGDSPCTGNALYCTRNLDCAPGEFCCISALGMADPPTSSAICVLGDQCPAGSDILCSTGDKPFFTGCASLETCKSGNLASALYGLPARDPWGVCE